MRLILFGYFCLCKFLETNSCAKLQILVYYLSQVRMIQVIPDIPLLAEEILLRSVRRLIVTANVPSSPILVTLMMEALNSS
jgi:hypothetical protein